MNRESTPQPEQYDSTHNAPPPRWPVELSQAETRAYGTPAYSAPTPASAVPVAAEAPRRRSVIGDISAGLFLGDFAAELGLPGAITQISVSFVPLIGSACAVRDLVADLRRHDRVGALLNFLALTPILGGFSKTFEVIRSTAHVGHAVHISRQQAHRRREEQAQAPRRASRR